MSTLKDMDLLEGAEEELAAAGSPQERNWRGVVIALIVIFVMCFIISIAVVLLTPLSTSGEERSHRVALSDVVGLTFLSSIESMEWLDDCRLVVRQSDLFEMLDLKKTPLTNSTRLLDAEAFYRYGKASSLSVSPDEKYILVGYSATKKSPKMVYRIYDRKTSTFENVGPMKSGDENVKVLVWNPTGIAFAYVHNGNVYYQQHPAASSQQITTDGQFDLLHGAADWLYEEEILQSPQALWWSKTGDYLAFLTIDNRLVSRADIPIYGQRVYPIIMQQSYPKTGAEHLPLTSLNVWRKADGALRQVNVTGVDPSQIIYLYSASWIRLHGADVLIAVWANRYQNTTVFSLCTFDSGVCVTNFVQKYSFDNFRLWAEPEDVRVRFYGDDYYFTLLPHRRSNGNVYTQIARVNVKKNFTDGRETFLSMGEYDVERIDYYDTQNDLVYFTAAAPDSSQRHLFVTSALSTSFTATAARCVSCGFSANCTFHDTSFALSSTQLTRSNAVAVSERFLYFNCKGPGTPHVIFARLLNATALVKVSEYGRNKALERALITHFLPRVKFDNFTLADGTIIYSKMLLPYDAPSKEPYTFVKRYPVLVNVYAGPGTQKATDEWLSSTLDVFFASSKEYAVVFVDGRGSGHRGWRQKQPIYGNFGTVEVDDQITAVRELLKRYPFLDRKRVGIWGWSYGGFVSARTLQRDTNSTFKCAASVAPVSNFKYYDATYTERYMGDASSEAYAFTDLTRNVSAFHRAHFMLVHGTADDNVHYQNTAEFVRALTEDNIQFEMMAYTDDSHNLASGRGHMYNMLTNFFKDCFA